MGYSAVMSDTVVRSGTPTARQQSVLDFISSYRQEFQTLPTKREIQNGLGYSSFNSVSDFFEALKKKGYLKESENNVGYMVVE